METFDLLCHPDTPAVHVRGIAVAVARKGDALSLRYRIACPPDQLRLPKSADPVRMDGLWQHTCMEAFIARADGSYCEFNFSPSGAWAAYAFDSYRAGMRDRDTSPPLILCDKGEDFFEVAATIDVTGLSGKLSLTAVVEEADGAKSYWALAHANGQPDFHHAACFAAMLPAPGEA
ncbi:DOMON-like domain-containing protein [Novosphingobium sp. NPDC080210]|uniref:DOMON-like domain-containing protein n=1 Tax=Novosphingobium sp. NPDC080210 TaxID=3390596 RepID=UPI003D04B0F2